MISCNYNFIGNKKEQNKKKDLKKQETISRYQISFQDE